MRPRNKRVVYFRRRDAIKYCGDSIEDRGNELSAIHLPKKQMYVTQCRGVENDPNFKLTRRTCKERSCPTCASNLALTVYKRFVHAESAMGGERGWLTLKIPIEDISKTSVVWRAARRALPHLRSALFSKRNGGLRRAFGVICIEWNSEGTFTAIRIDLLVSTRKRLAVDRVHGLWKKLTSGKGKSLFVERERGYDDKIRKCCDRARWFPTPGELSLSNFDILLKAEKGKKLYIDLSRRKRSKRGAK